MDFQKQRDEIEKIYNEVYSVNESLDVHERRMLIQGFEDTINEGIGSFLGKVAGKTKSFFKGNDSKKGIFGRIGDKSKELYNKGKEMAGKVWNSITEFFDGVVTKLKEGLNNAKEWVLNKYEKFKEVLSKVYTNAKISILNAYETMKDKMKEFGQVCSKIWDNILNSTKELITNIKEKFISLKDKFSEWLEKNKQSLMETATRLKESSIATLVRLGEKLRMALTSTKNRISQISTIVLSICSAPLIYLVNGIKKIPTLYINAIERIKNFIKNEIEDFKLAYSTEMARESFGKIYTFEGFKVK